MSTHYDVSHLLAGLMLLASFSLIYQDRVLAVLRTFAVQALLLAAAVAVQAWAQERPHLFITALLALGLKGVIIPMALHRMIFKLGIHRDVEQVVGVGLTMLLALALTALSLLLIVRATETAPAQAREGLAIALAIILLGMLMMITRRNAVTQIIGFMSIENGLILGA
ncbi:MAG: hydrogenase-4 component E, partial [Gammaproteobacteria bacterium]|nr:hydrogenase-4 component E [Gammaproteobacteria bacterium]